jgi:C_GCAxxG_C_C family probable redox protein
MAEYTPEEKNEALARVEQRAEAYNYEFAGCGQMVLLALQQEFKLPNGIPAMKAITFTGKATSGLGGVCGALVGAVSAIGLAAGRDKFEDPIWPNDEVKKMVKDFYHRFEEEFGSFKCGEILEKAVGEHIDPTTPEGSSKFDELGGRESCSKVCGKAARIAAETIMEIPRR